MDAWLINGQWQAFALSLSSSCLRLPVLSHNCSPSFAVKDPCWEGLCRGINACEALFVPSCTIAASRSRRRNPSCQVGVLSTASRHKRRDLPFTRGTSPHTCSPHGFLAGQGPPQRHQDARGDQGEAAGGLCAVAGRAVGKLQRPGQHV
eukprot:33570-Chlamydomonas_euryale.AAC.1